MLKEKIELTKSCKQLIESSAVDLISAIVENKKASHVRQSSFNYYSSETKEHYQVHVLVVRDERDFLGGLEIEEITRA